MSYTHLDSSTPKAKRVHKCDWCGQPINPGESYRRDTAVYEGRLSVCKMHPECNRAFCEVLKDFPSGALVGWDAKQPRGGAGDGLFEI